MAKITPKQRNEKRMEVYEVLKNFYTTSGEDIDYCTKGDTTTAILNFPTVIDGEDSWVEIMVSIPTREDYDGYAKREEYRAAVKKNEEKERERAEAKAKKIAKDKKNREVKKAEKRE